jgi:hypothetical protein
MFRTHEKFGCSVPNGDDNFVSCKQWLERFVNESGQAQVSDLDDAVGSDEDVGGFEIAM